MMRSKFFIIIIAIFILGAGCSVRSSGNSSLSAKFYDYKVNVIKSDVNTSILIIQDKKETNMLELMNKPENKFEMTGRKVTRVDGVIATASKEWNLYINDNKTELGNLADVMIINSDKIEWRYENIN